MLPAFTDEECCKEVAFVLMLQAYGRTFVPSIPISGKASEEERQETLFLMQAISSGKWNCFITHGAVLEFLIGRVYRRSDADYYERRSKRHTGWISGSALSRKGRNILN